MQVLIRCIVTACLLVILLGFSSVGHARASFNNDGAASYPLYEFTAFEAKESEPMPVTCRRLETQRVMMFFDNHGVLGTGYSNCQCDGETCLSFESPPASGKEHLFAGSIWFGGISGADTLVSVAADGWFQQQEYYPPVPAGYYEGIADMSVWTLCSDTFEANGLSPEDHTPMGLRVALRGHAWNGPPYDQTILYDLVLTNISGSVIEQGYVGIFIDGDVYHKSIEPSGFQDDLTGSLRDELIAYIIDDDGDPQGGIYVPATSVRQPIALSLLRSSFVPADTGFNWWLSNGMPQYDFGPRRVDSLGNPYCPYENMIRSGTPVYDRERYCVMSNGEWDYDMVYIGDTIAGWEAPPPSVAEITGFDSRFLMSLGPVDLAPDASLRLLFTTFTAGPVHVDPSNILNLADDPDLYLANLDFDSVIYYRQFADTLAELLVDPQLPVTGLYVQHSDIDSVAIEWDPWVFEDVIGYELFMQQIPVDSMPYAGILPPWVNIDPDALPSAAIATHPYRHVFTGLEEHRYYAVSAAHQLSSETGQRCPAVTFDVGGRIPAPEPFPKYVFFVEGQPVTIHWSGPDGIDVNHYNIYKLDWDAAQNSYEPYYDTAYTESGPQPRDSFFVDDDWYYYFAMQPYAGMYAPASQFSDFADDSTVYAVTAVDSHGMESGLSDPIVALRALPRTRDIVAVIVTGRGTPVTLSDSVAVREYFEVVLDGYDYSILNLRDSIGALGGDYRYRLWQDLMPFELVLFDDGMRVNYLLDDFEGIIPDGIEKYLLSGGELAYFCPALDMYGSLDPDWYSVTDSYAQEFFGVDSLFYTDLFYYFNDGLPPAPDTLLGGIRADGAADSIPDLRYDSTRYPFQPVMQILWDSTVMPRATAFTVDERGEVTHTAVSKYPSTSMIHSHANGVKTSTDLFTTYVFAFHPWYMTLEDSRALIEFISGYVPTDADPGEPAAVPDEISLRQNYPNPFNPTTTIMFTLPRQADVRLDIYNILGQRVRTLVDHRMNAGVHAVEWDSRDESGNPVASGIYLYRLKADDYSAFRKMVLVK